MTPESLAALAASGESETLEFKASTGTRRRAAETVCAMLNRRGGLVLFGVKPDGQVVGQQVGARTLEDLTDEIQRIEPAASPEIERVRISPERQVIVVRVDSGASRPYRYRGASYLRVGSATRVMSAGEYELMLMERMHGEIRWETEVAEGWTVDDLDTAEIRNMVGAAVLLGRLDDPGGREPEDLLRGLSLLQDGVPLRAAAVLFGKKNRITGDMPECTLRVARFRGVSQSEFLDNRQFEGNAFTLLASGERFLRDTVPIASRFEPGRMQRIDEPLYPPLAVREALANALCHRQYGSRSGSVGLAVYDDRLEVSSPGPLHFGLTPEDLFKPHASKPWNPLIARTFYRRGIIEEWGTGTLKMAQMATDAGLPHPEIEERNDWVVVRFRPADYVPPRDDSGNDLTARQKTVLALLRRTGGGLAFGDILGSLGPAATDWRVRADLEALRDRELVESSGWGRGARWKSR